MRIETVTVPYFSENCYLLFPADSSKCLVVDPGCGAVEEIKQCVSSVGAKVEAVLCTHGHADHYWEAAAVAEGAPVFMPAPDYSQFDPAQRDPRDQARYEERLPAYVRPEHTVALGDEAVSGAYEIIDGLYLRMVPAPGHTPGSSLFLFETRGQATGYIGTKADAFWREWKEISGQGQAESDAEASGGDAELEVRKFALVGDVIFAGSVGRTDLPRGDQKQMLHTLRTIQNVIDPDTVLLPGHGDITVLGWESKNNPYLAQARFQG